MRRKRTRIAKLTRRAFLGGVLSVAAAPLAVAAGDSFRAEAVPGGVRLYSGSTVQLIDGASLGDLDTRFSVLQTERGYSVSITNLSSPFEPDRLSVQLEFEPGDVVWTMRATTRGWPRSGKTVFQQVGAHEWLIGSKSPEVRVNADNNLRTSMSRLGVTLPGNSIRLKLRGDLTWAVDSGSSAARLTAFDQAVELFDLTLRRLLPGAAGFGEDFGPVAAVGSVLLSGSGRVRRRSLSVGQRGAFSIECSAPSEDGHFVSRNWDGPKRRLSRFEGPGHWRLAVRRGRTGEGEFVGDRGQIEEQEQRTAPTLSVVRLQLRTHPFILNTGAGRYSASGIGHEGDQFDAGIEVKAAAGDVVGFTGRVALHDAALAVAGADYARFWLGGVEVGLALKGLAPPVGSRSLLTLGAARLVASLDSARLRIVRAADLLGLRYQFRQLSLFVDQGKASIGPSSGQPDGAGRMIVILPPQHVAERAYFRQVSGGGPNDYPELGDPRFDAFRQQFETIAGNRGLDAAYSGRASLITPDLFAAATEALASLPFEVNADEQFQEITEARLSGETRLVFEVQQAEGQPRRIDLTVAGLTNWNAFDLAVVNRARSQDAPEGVVDDGALLEQTLRALGISGAAAGARSLSGRMRQVHASLSQPQEDETAIELPFRLMLSPDQRARWRTPVGSPTIAGATLRRPALLWTAELDNQSLANSVRAIWSNDFRPDVFSRGPGDTEIAQPPRGPYAPWLLDDHINQKEVGESVGISALKFRTSMDAFDRHELVGLTSVHGLPVLPRIMDGKVNGSQILAPASLRIDGADPLDPQAVYLPKALNINELSLSSLGGSIDLNSSFEPPAPITADDWKRNPFPAFSVEKWRQRTILGRDMAVEVVYKGMLFPLGLRAALVKLTERQFYWNPLIGAPSAFLIQRMMLTCARPIKMFPALNQPNAGRAWPAKQIELVTTRSPDILDPWADLKFNEVGEAANGLINLTNSEGASLPGAAFWPKTHSGRGGEVLFQVRFDGAASTVSWPLIFVDNAAVHDPRSMSALVKYYNEQVRKPAGSETEVVDDIKNDKNDAPRELTRRVEIDHRGASCRFAPDRTPQETSYVTHRWRLGVEGHSLGKDSEHDSGYVMTPDMEGLDQPPFYPKLLWAELSLTPIERMTGTAPPLVRARFEDKYLQYGLPERDDHPWTENPMEVFMRLHPQPQVDFGASSAGNRSGGLAHPNFPAVAISRRSGLVGHVADQSKPVPRPIPPADNSGEKDALVTPLDVSASLPDFDNPASFFGNAKILGLIPLKDVLNTVTFDRDKAPKIEQILDYAPGLRAAAAGIVERLSQTLGSVEGAIENLGRGIIFDLYPDLKDGLARLHASVDQAKASATPESHFGSMYAAGYRLLGAFERIAEDPLAPVREQARGILGELSTAIFGRVSAGLEELKAVVAGIAIDTIELWDSQIDVIATRIAQQSGRGPAEVQLISQYITPAIKKNLRPVGQGIVQINALISGGGQLTVPEIVQRLEGELRFAMANVLAQTRALLEDEAKKQIEAACSDAIKSILAAVGTIGGNQQVQKELRKRIGLLTKTLVDLRESLDRFRNDLSAGQTEVLREWIAAVDDGIDALNGASALRDALGEIEQLDRDLKPLRDAAAPACSVTEIVSAGDLEQALQKKVALVARIGDLPSSLVHLLAVQRAVASLNAVGAGVIPEAINRKVAEITDAATLALAQVAQLRSELLQAGSIVGAIKATKGGAIEGLLDLAGKGAEGGAELAAFLDRLNASAADLDAEVGKLVALIAGEAKIEPPVVSDAIRRVANAEVRTTLLLNQEQQSLVDRARQAVTAIARLADDFFGFLMPLLSRPLQLVAAIDRMLIQARDHAWEKVKPRQGGTSVEQLTDTLMKALTENGCVFLVRGAGVPTGEVCNAMFSADRTIRGPGDPEADDLAKELVVLDRLVAMLNTEGENGTNIAAAIAAEPDFRALLRAFGTGGPVAPRLVNQLTGALQGIIRKDMADLLPVDEISRQIESALREMVPSKATLRHSVGTKLGNFGVFEMVESTDRDLTIRAETTIDLLSDDRSPKVSIVGELQPFKINLFKGFANVDVVSLKFKKASFSSQNGSKPDFDIAIETVELGRDVEFLKDLQSWFNWEDNGLYVKVSLDQIEAGYTLAPITISIGTVSFINVAISAAITLPFSSAAAQFKVALSSRDAPFLISAAPYGGGGYLALIANAQRLVGFEAAFEYGGVAAFSYGPLEAIGRLTTGIFVSKVGAKAVIEGYFFAGGSGHIACFGFSSSFLLSLSHDLSTGKITGRAVYSFSFRIGFAKFKFQIVVWEAKAKGFKVAELDHLELGPGAVSRVAQLTPPISSAPSGSDEGAFIVSDAVSHADDWRTYQSYFDHSLGRLKDLR